MHNPDEYQFVCVLCMFSFLGAVTLVNISLLRNSIHMKVIKQNKFEISSSITIFELDNLEASKIRLDAFYH